jgi:hypothetical protein
VLISWVFWGTWTPKGAVSMTLVALLFGVHPFGAFWMIYECSRREKVPLGFVLLAFVPYTFLWYYFERVRKKAIAA